jgi:hypothetical protein
MGQPGILVQAISNILGRNDPPDMRQTPPDEVSQSDNALNEVELDLCLSCSEFQFDSVYEYASPTLKVKLRKLSTKMTRAKRKH